MTYTISNGLRDREYQKFTAAGSTTAVNIACNVKTYDYSPSDVTCASGTAIGYTGSNFIAYSDSLNGMLKGIRVLGNNYTTTGSLYINVSGGVNETIWYTTAAGISGLFQPRMYATNSINNTQISGTLASNSKYEEIPLFGIYTIIGSGIGGGKSGLGISLIYI